MRRRDFATGAVLAVVPRLTWAQRAGRVPLIGMLVPSSRDIAAANIEAFRHGLRELGYVDGQNLLIEYRFADAMDDHLPQLAVDLVRLDVNVIVTWGTPATFAAKNATTTIPIVIATAGDPVGTGLVSSLARPGGNITGQSSIAPDMGEKTLGLLREIVPNVSRVAILLNPANPFSAPTLRQAQIAAETIDVKLRAVEVRDLGELDDAFSAMTKADARGLMVVNDLIFLADATRIAALAAKNRLPTIFIRREYVEAGGLMSYGPKNVEQFRRAAAYVDKILKGAKPADLPVEQPTKFELVINLKTATALGLTVPQSLLQRADEVIE